MDSQVNDDDSNLKSYQSVQLDSMSHEKKSIPIPVPSKNMADSVHLCNFASKPNKGRARATWNNAYHQYLLPSPISPRARARRRYFGGRGKILKRKGEKVREERDEQCLP